MKFNQRQLEETDFDEKISSTQKDKDNSCEEKNNESKKSLRDYSDTSLEENPDNYNENVFLFLRSINFDYSLSLSEAVNKRTLGKRIVSIREADLLARNFFNYKRNSVSNGFDKVERLLMMNEFSNFISEGTPGDKGSLWHLRKRYNDGLKVIRSSNDIEYKKKCLDLLNEIGRYIIKFPSNFWEDEKKKGFGDFLLKPDYMTWDRYELIRLSNFKIEGNLYEK